MKKFSSRTAAVGMSGALALAGVVGAGVVSPANADATGTYTCTLTGVGPVPLGVSGSIAMPSTLQSGQTVSGLTSTMGVTLPAAVVTGLATAINGLQTVGGSATGVALPVTGASAIALNDLSIPQTSPSSTDGTLTMLGSATSKAFRAPLPGTYKVMMPADFSFSPIGGFGAGAPTLTLPAVPCHSDSPQQVASMTVVKATSTTTAKLLNAPVTTVKHAKILSTVKAAGHAATGKVYAYQGTKLLKSATLSGGKATLVLPLLARGSHTIKVLYKATTANKASSKSMTFSVTRG